MKKQIMIGCILGGMAACTAPSDGYLLTGHIEGAGNGKAVLIRNTETEMPVNGDTVEMQAGKFIFTGKFATPGRVSLQVCPENEQPANLGFFAENAQIRVNGNWKDVKEQYGYRFIENVKIDGSRNNEVYEEITAVYQQLLKAPEHKIYAQLQDKLAELRQSDADAYYKLQNETEKLAEEFNRAVRQRQLELIRENKSVESVASCLRFLWNDMTLDELRQIYQVLDTNVQHSPLAAELREELAIREKVKPGMPAPDFSLETPDGSCLALSDLKGKYVVLDFWASWCKPCRASFPEMKKIYERYKDKGLEILGVTNDSRKQDWLKALEQDQLPWKQVIDEYPIKNEPAKIATLYAIPYLPTLILIGPDGRSSARQKTSISW
ncbi:MAG: redoxin domain-containing protein [Odoribacter splanchnicus]